MNIGVAIDKIEKEPLLACLVMPNRLKLDMILRMSSLKSAVNRNPIYSKTHSDPYQFQYVNQISPFEMLVEKFVCEHKWNKECIYKLWKR